MDDDFKTQVHFEWVAEPADEHGDIIDPLFGNSFEQVRGFVKDYPCHSIEFALVRNSGNEADGLQERGYAYLDEAGQLPERFDCDHKVPARYRGKTFNTGG